MGSYTLALLGLVRVVSAARMERREPATPHMRAWPIAKTLIAGTALGLAMPAFYLLPAAYERRFVQISMALVPELSYPNNFLFHQTADKGHDFVLHQASVLAVTLLALTAMLLAVLYWLRCKKTTEEVQEESTTRPLASFALVAVLIAFLLEPLSAPVWKHLPELAFLQFPWRFLAVLGVVLALTIGFLANHLRVNGGGIVVAMLAIVAGTSFSVRPWLSLQVRRAGETSGSRTIVPRQPRRFRDRRVHAQRRRQRCAPIKRTRILACE